MATALWIAAGGAVGTLARFGLSGLINDYSHPWGTVTVNVVGSLALGILAGLWGVGHVGDQQLALTVGLLGGFTTFSTFALDTLRLWEEGQGALALVNVVVSVVFGLAAAIGGLAIGRAVAS
jgi:CrcB protein